MAAVLRCMIDKKEITMNNVDKVKNMVLAQLVQSDSFLLNAIYARCVQEKISDEEAGKALSELEQENEIRLENLRGMFWQLKILKA